MRLADFDFELPADRIALRPARPRDAARLLCVAPNDENPFRDKLVSDLTGLLSPGDGLVFNDTRVIPARLDGARLRAGGRANISVTLIKRTGASQWRALARPAKRLKPGDRIQFGGGGEAGACGLSAFWAEVGEIGAGGEVVLCFELMGAALDQAIAATGNVPLPPYIATKRAADEADRNDYQTVYAAREGAVAAPTAGLHFTETLMAGLEARGISRHFVTLHVGAGTFLPVKVDDLGDHAMQSEWGEVSPATASALNALRAQGGKLVAVGTTAARLLESAAAADGRIAEFSGDTNLFITPGYRFKAVDRLLTNFHLPRSTLFMLVAAFSGLDPMKRAYAHAIAKGYRFYSYGDACLLDPAGEGP